MDKGEAACAMPTWSGGGAQRREAGIGMHFWRAGSIVVGENSRLFFLMILLSIFAWGLDRGGLFVCIGRYQGT